MTGDEYLKKETQRTFILGDEWYYFKIYTGFKTADAILINAIFPLCNRLIENEIIDKWFFIRYTDPKHHLRIRFHIKGINNIPAIIVNFNRIIKPYLESGLVWKIQADTYHRELERYGTSTIEQIETLFFHDSEMICKIISLEQIKKNENLRWLVSLRMIDTLLNDFGLILDNKYKLLNSMQEYFSIEFGANSAFKRQLGQKYRKEKANINHILDFNSDSSDEFTLIHTIINSKSKRVSIFIQQIKEAIHKEENLSLERLLQSIIHMMLNRLFVSQNRHMELVIYDLLFRYYDSMIKRLKTTTSI